MYFETFKKAILVNTYLICSQLNPKHTLKFWHFKTNKFYINRLNSNHLSYFFAFNLLMKYSDVKNCWMNFRKDFFRIVTCDAFELMDIRTNGSLDK